jgi:hypothetical protein
MSGLEQESGLTAADIIGNQKDIIGNQKDQIPGPIGLVVG